MYPYYLESEGGGEVYSSGLGRPFNGSVGAYSRKRGLLVRQNGIKFCLKNKWSQRHFMALFKHKK